MAKWIVGVKGAAGSESFEISVVRSDNAHGISSYGWFDASKLLVTHNGGPCHWPVTQRVWDGCLRLAQEIAGELNAADGAA
jgi:hypothetical protein